MTPQDHGHGPRGPDDRDAMRRRVLFLLVPGVLCIMIAIIVAAWLGR